MANVIHNSLAEKLVNDVTKVSRGTSFPTRMHLGPATTQISLRNRNVASLFAGHFAGSRESNVS